MIRNEGTYDSTLAKEANLNKILSVFGDLGVTKVYVKRLAPNDNSKNQPYFGPQLTDLSFIPTGDLIPSVSTSGKTIDPKRKIKFQASLNFSWVDVEGKVYDAPHAKLIYYPQYPEVRFSGFLLGSKVNAGKWMDPYKQGRSKGRWLILGVNPKKTIYSYLVTPECNLSKELDETELIEINSVFSQITTGLSLTHTANTRDAIIAKLLEIHQMGWIPGQKLNSDMTVSPYRAQNGGGYTLEAQLGISPNGFSEPDYLGWEVKQFGVKKFPKTGASPTTLMTPEPNGGFYCDHGAESFVRRYGYKDKSGIPDRLNFGGLHRVGEVQNLTGLTLRLFGFDPEDSVITDAEGVIALVEAPDKIAASWSYAKMMDHWKRKHSQAVYIPCMRNRNQHSGTIEYHYGKDIELGTSTSFEMFLTSMNSGQVYYDPGIKLEQASTPKPKPPKRRSQFRVNHKHLDILYKNFDFVDISE